MPIKLEIRGVPNCVSFKNTKMIARKRLITDPRKQEVMEAYTLAIMRALYCAYQTSEIAMATGCSLQSWIASCMPADDSWKHIPEGSFKVILVPQGQEGADITITPLKS